jgi:hypothetical protein
VEQSTPSFIAIIPAANGPNCRSLPTKRPDKTDGVMDLLTDAGCQVLFLVDYSPDLSPIEAAFSKLKAFIRRCRCRTIRALIRAIAQVWTELQLKMREGVATFGVQRVRHSSEMGR